MEPPLDRTKITYHKDIDPLALWQVDAGEDRTAAAQQLLSHPAMLVGKSTWNVGVRGNITYKYL